jgi:allantoin racemase
VRLLLANPNTTKAVTDRVVREALRCASAGTEIVGVTADFGVAIVSTAAENVIAGHAALDLVAAHGKGCDAVIIAMSFDTGVHAARQLFAMPVIGITEAALHTACLAGGRFGLVVPGAVSVPLYLDLIDRSGLRGRMAALEVVEMDSVTSYLDEAGLEQKLRAAAERLAARPEIEAIVLSGAASAGVARRIQPGLAVPIVDGVAAAIRQAELLVALDLGPRVRPRRLAAGEPTTGLSPPLTQAFETPGQPSPADGPVTHHRGKPRPVKPHRGPTGRAGRAS